MLRAGSRVQLSDEYLSKFAMTTDVNRKRVGRITSIKGNLATVRWDGRKTTTTYHTAFIRAASPKDDLEAALENLLGPL